jgi:hypothetical protein
MVFQQAAGLILRRRYFVLSLSQMRLAFALAPPTSDSRTFVSPARSKRGRRRDDAGRVRERNRARAAAALSGDALARTGETRAGGETANSAARVPVAHAGVLPRRAGEVDSFETRDTVAFREEWVSVSVYERRGNRRGAERRPDYRALRRAFIGDFSLAGGFFSAWASARRASSRFWRR